MCGIAGMMAMNAEGRQKLPALSDMMSCLKLRGPDAEGSYFHGNVALAHTQKGPPVPVRLTEIRPEPRGAATPVVCAWNVAVK